MKFTDVVTYIPPMKRWRPFWTAKIGETEFTGKDREEATTALFTNIKTILSGDYIPTMIFHHGYVALVWRELSGWSYTIRKATESGPVMSNIHCIGAKEPTEAHARLHLAQYVLDDVRHPEEAAECITDERDRHQFLSDYYRGQAIARIMEERGVDHYHASMIYDGLRD